MIKREEVYKIGIFNKPHGIHGELQFTFTDDIFDRVEAEYVVCWTESSCLSSSRNTASVRIPPP